MANTELASYSARCLSALRDDIDQNCPELASQIKVDATETAVAAFTVKVDLKIRPSIRQRDMQPQEKSQVREASNVDDIHKELTVAAEKAAFGACPSHAVETSGGYPKLSDEFVLIDDVLSLIHRYTCSSCKGKKQLRCTDCKGQGGTRCPECSGRGSVTCYECRGVQSSGANDGWCRSCNGSARVTCRSCNGGRQRPCKTCRGKASVKCPTCAASGFQRSLKTVSLVTIPAYEITVDASRSDVVEKAINAIGGAPKLSSSFGTILALSQSPNQLSYRVEFPYCEINVTHGPSKSRTLFAGVRAITVEAGDFLETSLSGSLEQLETLLNTSSAAWCDQNKMRSSLRSVVAWTPHAILLANPQLRPNGMSEAYAARAVVATQRCVKMMRDNLIFRRFTIACVAAPLLYLLLNILRGISFLAFVPWLVSMTALTWISVEFSMRVMIASMTDEKSLKDALLNM